MPLIILAFLKLFNVELLNDTFQAVLSFGIALTLPLLGIYFLSFSPIKLRRWLFFFATFFIVSFIPYELGILNSTGDFYNLSKYGTQIKGLAGPFQGSHPASMALAGSFIVILYFWFDKTFNRFILTTLLILCVYFLVNTYVRTGMAMAIFGAIPLITYFIRKDRLTKIRLFFIVSSLTVLVSFWVLDNNILVNRILGQDKYSKEDSLEEIGSGRGLIYLTNIQIFEEAEVFEKLFGIGTTQLMIRTEKKLGSRLLSHNGFLQTLLTNGIVGLIVLLVYFKKLYMLKDKLVDSHKAIILSFVFALVVMSFVQDYDVIYFHILMMISISIFIQESSIIRLNKMRSQVINE